MQIVDFAEMGDLHYGKTGKSGTRWFLGGISYRNFSGADFVHVQHFKS